MVFRVRVSPLECNYRGKYLIDLFVCLLTIRPLLCCSAVHLELYGRDKIRSSKRISNPGCYATSTQLLIAPLVNYVKPGSLPTVFGVSGHSGGGTIMERDASGKFINKPKISSESLQGGFKPYSLTGHIHEREASHHLSSLLLSEGQLKIAFIPSVAPWFSGIISTGSIHLKEKMSAKDVTALFVEKYKDEKLIKVQKDIVQLKDVEGKHGWSVGGFQLSIEGDRAVIVVGEIGFLVCSLSPENLFFSFGPQGGLDNLLKGAATQCLQVCKIS